MTKRLFGDTSGAMVGTVESLYAGAIVTVQVGTADAKNLILISCNRVQTADYQLLKSIGGDYAINAFGAGPVMMSLKGLQPAKAPACEQNAGSTANLNEAAQKSIEAWYAELNIGAENPQVISVGVNGVAFKGYAYSLTTNPQSAATGGFDYTLQIIAYPMIQSSTPRA